VPPVPCPDHSMPLLPLLSHDGAGDGEGDDEEDYDHLHGPAHGDIDPDDDEVRRAERSREEGAEGGAGRGLCPWVCMRQGSAWGHALTSVEPGWCSASHPAHPNLAQMMEDEDDDDDDLESIDDADDEDDDEGGRCVGQAAFLSLCPACPPALVTTTGLPPLPGCPESQLELTWPSVCPVLPPQPPRPFARRPARRGGE